MSINASYSKLVDADTGQDGAGADAAAEAVESSLRYVQSQIEAVAPSLSEELSLSDGLAPAIADWFDRLRGWDADLRTREAAVEQQAADVAARRRELARDIRRHRRGNHGGLGNPAVATESQVAALQQQFEQLTTALLAGGGQTGWSDGEPRDPALALLEQRIDALIEQNEQLASELAHNTVKRSVGQSSDASATLTWEQRKALLYRQYESEATDGSPQDGQCLGDSVPQAAAELQNELANLQQALRDRNAEIGELRALLDNRSVIEQAVGQDQELAMGASLFAKMFDGDELVREERTRLKELQSEWEAKFRDLEIAASIERANLARERRELERQNAELEEQLAHLQQDLRQESVAGPNQSRRWMAKLGLGE